MRVLFYGTPKLAVPTLELLAGRETVVAAVTRPDRPAGRGLKSRESPVKARARELGIPVFDPVSLSGIAPELKGLEPELGVVVAYGRILKPELLAVPRLGTLNVHYSLLPKYRGAAPVQWSLARGEARTGVSLFWLDEGMDTGPIFLSRELEVGPEEDAGELQERLVRLGLGALGDALSEIEAGRIRREPQRGEASLAPLIKREDARIDLARSAAEIHNLVRGMSLWPRAFLDLKTPPLRLLVLKTRLGAVPAGGFNRWGAILSVERDGGILIECGGGSSLWLLTVQPEGKKPLPAADFLNGLRLGAGDFLPV